MVKGQTFRQRWDAHCDHVNATYHVASWYEGETRRLRVGYHTDKQEARLYVARTGGWTLVATRWWGDLEPSVAECEARGWLAYEESRRWPDPPTAVVCPVGHRYDGRLRTVRR